MSEEKKCFNCKEITDHRSADCPKSQLYTRCGFCRKFAFDEDGHGINCPFKATFRSMRNDIRCTEEVENVVKLNWKSRKEVSVVGESANLIPLPKSKTVISRSLVVSNQDDTVNIDGPKNVNHTIVIENASRQARVKLVAGSQLEINGRYKIGSDGLVKYVRNNLDFVAAGRSDCRLPVNENEHVFWLRIEWKGERYILEVVPTGVILHDNAKRVLESQLETIRK